MNWFGWALLSAIFAAATAILAKIGVAGIDSNLATAIRTSVVLLFAWMISLVTAGPRGISQIQPRSWVFLVLSGLATGLSWLCYFRALQLGPASKVAPIDKLSLVLVVIAAAIFLGEKISVGTAVGVAFMFVGALILAAS